MSRSADGVLRTEKTFAVRFFKAYTTYSTCFAPCIDAELLWQELLPDQIDALQNLAEMLAKTSQPDAASTSLTGMAP